MNYLCSRDLTGPKPTNSHQWNQSLYVGYLQPVMPAFSTCVKTLISLEYYYILYILYSVQYILYTFCTYLTNFKATEQFTVCTRTVFMDYGYVYNVYVVFKVESLFKFDPKHLKLQNQSNSIFDSFSFVMRVFWGYDDCEVIEGIVGFRVFEGYNGC